MVKEALSLTTLLLRARLATFMCVNASPRHFPFEFHATHTKRVASGSQVQSSMHHGGTWEAHIDKASGRPFWRNRNSSESTWFDPEGECMRVDIHRLRKTLYTFQHDTWEPL